MRAARLRSQRGVAMLLVLAAIAMGTTWMVVSRLNAASNDLVLAKRAHNTRVLAQAKQALIGYVVAQANKEGENNPGALPCPEDPGNFDSAANQGKVGSNCATTVKVGRFPWRTLGLDKLVDADGEPLWYAVSPNWGTNTSTNSVINSESTGQLTIDGVANAAIAVIIAPGAAFNVPAATGCTAWNQTRPQSGTPDWRNYLECENASSPADSAFVTTGPDSSFNDQVIALTAPEIIAPLEGAIANRIQREIVPELNSLYTASAWNMPAGSNPVYPFAARFDNPSPDTGSYRGESGRYAGLLPVNQTQGCTESASDPRCAATTFLSFSKGLSDIKTGGDGSIRTQSTCAWSSDTYICTGEYLNPSISVTITVNVTNVAMGLRKLDTSKVSFTAMNDTTGGWGTQTISHTTTAQMQTDGSVNLVIAGGMLPDISTAGWGTYANYRVSIQRAALADHDIVATPSTPNDLNWFVRNGWHKLTYYAVASGHTAATVASERSCTTSSSCLTLSSGDPRNPISTPNAARAILILTGRSINGSTRPSSTLTDYLEYGNATGRYERQRVSPVTVSSPYADTGTTNAYSISATSIPDGKSIYFRAASANTGPATLFAPATVAAKPIVNTDGSALAAGQIPANGVVEVTYDGTQFTLRKSPYNDRVVVVSSN